MQEVKKSDNLFLSSDEFNFKEFLFSYIGFLKYIVVAVLISAFCAFLSLRYSDVIYSTETQIKLLNNDEQFVPIPTQENFFSNSTLNIENEIHTITSSSLLEKLVRKLNITTSLYSQGDIKLSFIKNPPFSFSQLIHQDSIRSSMQFNVKLFDNGQFVISNNSSEDEIRFNKNTYEKTHNFPFNISNIKNNVEGEYVIKFHKIEDAIASLQSSINVKRLSKNSEIIVLNHLSTLPEFSRQVLDELVNLYNIDGMNDRQLVYKSTIEFINERFFLINSDLDSIEYQKENYKQSNKLVDPIGQSISNITEIKSIESKLFELSKELDITEGSVDFVRVNDTRLIPVNLANFNSEINSLISDYNINKIEYDKLSSLSGEENPIVLQLKNELFLLKKNLLSSLLNHLKIIKSNINFYENELTKINNKVSNVSKQEKILRAINRKQSVKESLFLFLMQKREESEISFAATEPSVKIIEKSRTFKKPVYPNKGTIYLSFIIGAIGICVFIIYIIILFDTKISSREIIEKKLGNFVGEVPFIEKSDEIFFRSKDEDRSPLAESFRMIASNVKFMLPNIQKNESNIIMCTSSIKGEGKTFCALNLALSLSSFNSRVLLIGCDLRNPQLHRYFNVEKSVLGLTNYLTNPEMAPESLILNFNNKPDNFDIILSGPLPPNPVSLINNGMLQKLFEKFKKQYDYIVIDTAPCLLVTDSLSLFSLTDLVLYVTRSGFTEKQLLDFPKKLIASGQLKNVGFVLNSVGKNKFGYSYGYKYGYGYSYKYSYNYGYGYGYTEDK